ncbi:sugar transferase [Mycobacterium sp. OTB74]|jgi:exopolysaccharide biosynthesis polyprenyl glycosylphosphotransferase|uniref:sugar transferase n=1 Tax=Mycobacterium sp. OTB74 TaxID=1853452 RepID=UPI00247603EC|nr:sugar transferase [Mycobacterium sp. OTB74]MDH6242393.1 exopolysaccharide biosynthesis polyprenyl glycosylphosphotransferase [Mycobacterium sp. OTB74]
MARWDRFQGGPGGAAIARLQLIASRPGVAISAKSSRLARIDWQRRFQTLLVLSDFLTIATVVALAQVIRFGELRSAPSLRFTLVNYCAVSVVIVVMWMTALGIYGSRLPRIFGNGLEETRRVFSATVAVFGAIAVVSMLVKLEIARGYLAIALPLGLIGLLITRGVARHYVTESRRGGVLVNNVLAVGNPRSVKELAECFSRHPGDGLRLVGACGPGLAAKSSLAISIDHRIPVLSEEDDIVSVVHRCGADTVVLTSGQLGPDEIRDLSWQLEKFNVDLVLAPGIIDVAAPRLTVRLAGGQPLIHVEKPRYNGAKRFQKRAFDVWFALAVLVVMATVMFGVAIAIKLTSRGPVFYLSERVGLDGVSFRMAKFRTMVVDADKQLDALAHLNESEGGVLFKIKNDPRVTPIGRFLRRYSIDELPQFFNVLTGTMSVVGPRPPLPREADTYDLRTRRRLLVRPGITGLWQVSGRSDLSWEDSVRLDLSYVENWSMAGDLVIALSTARAVFTSSGAY